MHEAAEQLGRRVAAQRLVQAVRGGERVVHGVPVAVVVLRVEPHDAQRGGERERASELLGRGAAGHRAQERVDHRIGVVGEELPPEVGDVLIGQLTAYRFAFAPRVRQSLVGALHRARRGRAGGATRRPPPNATPPAVSRTSVGSTVPAASAPT